MRLMDNQNVITQCSTALAPRRARKCDQIFQKPGRSNGICSHSSSESSSCGGWKQATTGVALSSIPTEIDVSAIWAPFEGIQIFRKCGCQRHRNEFQSNNRCRNRYGGVPSSRRAIVYTRLNRICDRTGQHGSKRFRDNADNPDVRQGSTQEEAQPRNESSSQRDGQGNSQEETQPINDDSYSRNEKQAKSKKKKQPNNERSSQKEGQGNLQEEGPSRNESFTQRENQGTLQEETQPRNERPSQRDRQGTSQEETQPRNERPSQRDRHGTSQEETQPRNERPSQRERRSSLQEERQPRNSRSVSRTGSRIVDKIYETYLKCVEYMKGVYKNLRDKFLPEKKDEEKKDEEKKVEEKKEQEQVKKNETKEEMEKDGEKKMKKKDNVKGDAEQDKNEAEIIVGSEHISWRANNATVVHKREKDKCIILQLKSKDIVGDEKKKAAAAKEKAIKSLGATVYHQNIRCICINGRPLSGAVKVLVDYPQKLAFVEITCMNPKTQNVYNVKEMMYLQPRNECQVSWVGPEYEPEPKESKQEKKEKKRKSNATQQDGDNQNADSNELESDSSDSSKSDDDSKCANSIVQISFCSPDQRKRFQSVIETLKFSMIYNTSARAPNRTGNFPTQCNPPSACGKYYQPYNPNDYYNYPNTAQAGFSNFEQLPIGMVDCFPLESDPHAYFTTDWLGRIVCSDGSIVKNCAISKPLSNPPQFPPTRFSKCRLNYMNKQW